MITLSTQGGLNNDPALGYDTILTNWAQGVASDIAALVALDSNGDFETINVSGNADIGGNLAVAGDAYITGALTAASIEAGSFTVTGLTVLASVAAAVTAHAGGGGVGTATELAAYFNNISVCATAGDSVSLPTSPVKRTLIVANNGAASATLYPFTGGTINGGGADAPIKIPAGTVAVFYATDTDTWKSNTVRIATGDGTVALPAHTFATQPDMGTYKISSSQLGVAISGALATLFDASGIKTDSVRARVEPGTVGAGTVTASTTGDGRSWTTVLTLTDFVVGALAGAAAALGVGGKFYSTPAGMQLESAYSIGLSLKCAGTAAATDTGIGSVVASGAISVLDGTATFENRLTGQTITTASGGGTVVSAIAAGESLAANGTAGIKDFYLNSAAAWNANNTGNLTATGTIILKWVQMS